MPKKIRELKSDLRRAGWYLKPGAGKGSHSVWEHSNVPYNVTVSGHDGHDAQRYQEIMVRKAVRAAEGK
jgi:predicted RNA binding protein YcfA (HicA-like mRNA interferase family)